jgi:hypothetical protein
MDCLASGASSSPGGGSIQIRSSCRRSSWARASLISGNLFREQSFLIARIHLYQSTHVGGAVKLYESLPLCAVASR